MRAGAWRGAIRLAESCRASWRNSLSDHHLALLPMLEQACPALLPRLLVQPPQSMGSCHTDVSARGSQAGLALVARRARHGSTCCTPATACPLAAFPPRSRWPRVMSLSSKHEQTAPATVQNSSAPLTVNGPISPRNGHVLPSPTGHAMSAHLYNYGSRT